MEGDLLQYIALTILLSSGFKTWPLFRLVFCGRLFTQQVIPKTLFSIHSLVRPESHSFVPALLTTSKKHLGGPRPRGRVTL
jgi:hypothetical protein